jgi:hypothetical protein
VKTRRAPKRKNAEPGRKPRHLHAALGGRHALELAGDVAAHQIAQLVHRRIGNAEERAVAARLA